MDGKQITLCKQSWKTWLKVLINYTKGFPMDVVDFIMKISPMKHPDYVDVCRDVIIWKMKPCSTF